MAQRALDFHKRTPGLYRREKIRRCFEEVLCAPVSKEEVQDKEKLFANMVVTQAIAAPWIEGAKEFLESNLTKLCYVVSAAPREEVRMIIQRRGMMPFFRDVYGGPERKGDMIAHILKVESCFPIELLFIGDSLSDFNASEEVGVPFLGIVRQGAKSPFPSQVYTLSDLTNLPIFLKSLK